MPVIKLKRSPDASTILEFFDTLPSWENLSSKIANDFNIPVTNVGAAYVHTKNRESVTLSNNQGLQQYFSGQSCQEFKFVVQDLHKPDTANTIATTWSAASNPSGLANTSTEIKVFCMLLAPLNPIFSVNIDKNLTVDDLRFGIKKTMGASFPHYELSLWQINPPIPSTDIGQPQSPEDIKGCIKLDPTSLLSVKFPSPLTLDIHVAVMHIPSRKRSRSLTTEESEGSKRICARRKDRRLPSEATLQDYHKMFQHLSNNPQWYSNPQNCHSIPFPFSFSEPPERFSVQDGKFKYMGRKEFQKVHEKVSSLKTGGGGTRLYIQGTMGYGKSHILAALACLLYRQGKLVVFIPDVRALLLAPFPYITTALLCTFAGPSYKEERKEIRACKSMDDLTLFYHGIPFVPYLIVDQINAFELSDPNTDSISREAKEACRLFINNLSVGSYTITSASGSYQTAMYMEKKQTNETKLPLMGGMSTEEMEQWWHHHRDKLPKFENDEQRVEVEELTGRIPLLLRPLLRFCQQGFREVEQDFWACPEIEAVRRNIEQFSESRRKIGEREYNDYIETLRGCIIRGSTYGHPDDSFDYQYFYRDGRSCDYTCGLAREAATSVIARSRKHGKFYEHEWINSLRFYKNNPAALGNQVELICLACIADMGINHGDVHIKSKVPVTFVGSLDSFLDAIPSDPPPGFYQLYLPKNPRFEDINGAYVEYNHKTDTVHVILLRVTINGRHKDSETLFYNKWGKWESKFCKHKLTSTFVWIVESEIFWKEVKKTTRETRQTTQVIKPRHKSASVPLVKVHMPLANELARIRQGMPS